MNRTILVFALGLTLGMAGLLAADDCQRLAGVWRFQAEVDTKADGSPAFGDSPADYDGLLIYTADCFMSVNIMPKGRKWSPGSATLAELRNTASDGTAYAGRYEVDPSAHTITHITSVSLDPEYQGKRLVRTYSLEGKTLKLSGSFPFEGETIHFVITWVRAEG